MSSGLSSQYDVIVVGAGHAGCEAALAAARMGCRTLLFSINLDTVAHMPCSPSIGGVGKGHLVKEVDALGGEMGKAADLTALQYRTLNTRKGPAVRSTRTQNDKARYRILMKGVVERQSLIDLKQTLVEEILAEDGRVVGVRDHIGAEFFAATVVLTTGTFLHGLIHIGRKQIPSGRAGEFPADGLAESLRNLGFGMGRMKTGTPARVRRDTIDFSRFDELRGDEEPNPFSLFTKKTEITQIPCHIGRTGERTREIIRRNIHLSPLYNGTIHGVSARYCPSLEDKMMKFPEREQHQIILEPEGLDTEEIYVSGTGNSLPYEVQIDLVRSVPGLEDARVMRPAYAIEYDFVYPTQLKPTLETKLVDGLFFAGQINGTSGYEEAAAQGLWAGVNAALKVQKRRPFILDRSEAYMGVMVDDLVTRGTSEPYRIFTSRAEYRLLLREDNAAIRLVEKGFELGLQDREALERVVEKERRIEIETRRLEQKRVRSTLEANRILEKVGSVCIDESATLSRILRRPEVSYADIEAIEGATSDLPADVKRQVEVRCKYDGYIRRQEAEVRKFKHLERLEIPGDFDYRGIPGLSNELKQKLDEIRPLSLGQASRIEGMTPAALSVLMVFLKRHREGKTS